MEAKDVKLMFSIIVDICERTFFLNQNQNQSESTTTTEIFDEKIYQLPSFIESLSSVCNQIDGNLPEGSLNILEKLVILSIDSYPKLIKRYNHQISSAIASLFLAIQLGKSGIYAEFISRVIYQSMIRIFSYKTSYFLDQAGNEPGQVNDEQNQKNPFNVTSSDYVMFWSNLLNLSEFKELNYSINDKKKLTGVIYDEFIEALIKVMKKLDLNAVKVENSEEVNQSELTASSNPMSGLKPLRPRDFEILVNLVDFSKYFVFKKKFFSRIKKF